MQALFLEEGPDTLLLDLKRKTRARRQIHPSGERRPLRCDKKWFLVRSSVRPQQQQHRPQYRIDSKFFFKTTVTQQNVANGAILKFSKINTLIFIITCNLHEN